jgi:hypothetical protein
MKKHPHLHLLHLPIAGLASLLSACGSGADLGGEVSQTAEALGFSSGDFGHDHGSRCESRESRQNLSATLLGRYASGLEGLESSAETVAVSRDRMFVTNAEAAALDIVDISSPESPVLLERVDLTGYGPAIQSVDVSSKGLVAVAVSGARKTDPGQVVFLDEHGSVLRTAVVGALPDMVAFTNDGRRLVVANEGEPDCYGTGCTDPVGSVSIIEVHPLKPVLPVKTIGFEGVTLPPGVRVFGPGATPAQDLEPEYVAISHDDRTAYVTLQEANAVAVIDLKRAKVTEVRALGYKDFSAPASTSTYTVENLPLAGTTAAGQEITLGGLSGLFFEGKAANGRLKFLAHTDRGPNGEPVSGKRPFLLPDFAPSLVRIEVDPALGEARFVEQIQLKNSDGSLLTGLPNTAVPGGNANTPHNDELPMDLFGQTLALDPLGGDFEGVAVAADGTFWMCDEYRPAIYQFDTDGRLLRRLVPIGAHAAAGLAVPAPGVAGELGIEALPSVIAQRRQNRGFEGLALQNGKIYAFVQSPLRNPTSLSNATLTVMKNVRLVEVDPTTLATRQFIYVLDNPPVTGAADTPADKIGDLAAVPGGGFMALERDDDALPEDAPETITKKVYSFSLTGATDITTRDTLYAGKTLDQMTATELTAAGVAPIAKVLHVDLVKAGYANAEKVEGLAYIDPTKLAVINDNDFGVSQIVIDQTTGTFTRAEGYEPEPVLLGIIESGGFDASDRDNVINIRDWPVYGMYQPDAIATFETCGETYLATANEGDTRDYDGFSEEARARSISSLYPAIPEVRNDRELGRLTITTAPPGGDLSRPYVFGTRSFTIWNARTGAQVWDSGTDFEKYTAQAFPANFNSNHEANEFDTRSDNKGPEPEGIAIGRLGRRTYAFVGLERIGGVMIYDVTNPSAPVFNQYLTTRDFSGPEPGPDLGPEIVRFVPRADSPIRRPLLVVANEISGTVVIWQLDTH